MPVILLDVVKGVAAVLIAGSSGGSTVEVLAATRCVLGHAFPVFLGFGGGKGVAVGAGATFALTPLIGVLDHVGLDHRGRARPATSRWLH